MMNISQFGDFANDFHFFVDTRGNELAYSMRVTHSTTRGNFTMTDYEFRLLLKVTQDEYMAMKRQPWPPAAYSVIL